MQVLGHVYPDFVRDEHIELFESFGRAELNVGVQSFDEKVLVNLGRPFDLARFERALAQLSGRFPIDMEIILGLPGDNPSSFRRTFEKAMDLAGKVRVFWCLALPDALLERAAEFEIDFDPETFELRSCRGWSPESLRAEKEYVCDVASRMYRPMIGPSWAEFRPVRGADGRSVSSARLTPQVAERLRRRIEVGQTGLRLLGMRTEGDRLVLELEDESGALVLEAAPTRGAEQHFVQREGISYSHRGKIPRPSAQSLRSLIDLVHPDVRPVVQPSPSDPS
jgi:hypothetical protein